MSVVRSHMMQGGGGYLIDNSLRFNAVDSAYLSRTPSAGNRRTWGLSAWVKKCKNTASGVTILSAGADSQNNTTIMFYQDRLRFNHQVSASTVWDVQTTALYRDQAAWMHLLVLVDTTQGTAADRVRFIVNGVSITDLTVATYPTQNYDLDINTANVHSIGGSVGWSYIDAYMAEMIFADGVVLDYTALGEVNTQGVWVPRSYTGSYGTNGFHLDFANGTDLGNDVSGNNNDLSPTNLASTDQVQDTPTNNYCVWNAVKFFTANTNPVLSDGNLVATNAGYNTFPTGTIGVSSGKWYWEVYGNTVSTGANLGGIVTSERSTPTTNYGVFYRQNGNKIVDGTETAYGNSYTSGDTIGVALDADNDEVVFYKNNVAQNSGTPISFTRPVEGGDVIFPGAFVPDTVSGVITADFGQSGFTYTPPTGYEAICTDNLPGLSVIDGESLFNTTLYTGNDADRTISGVGFQPDLVWTKGRTSAVNHRLFDSSRDPSTGNKELVTNNTYNEGNQGSMGLTFNTDGWDFDTDVGSNNEPNASATGTYVAWCVKERTGFFAIDTWSGDNASTQAHSLGVTPELIIVKCLSSLTNWPVRSDVAMSAGRNVYLNSSLAQFIVSSATANGGVSDTSNSSTIGFTSGTVDNLNVNKTGETYVGYTFASVEGFCKIGTYTGLGDGDGPFTNCGFRPALVLIKRLDGAEGWIIVDTVRSTANPIGPYLAPDSSGVEGNDVLIDTFSNGFKIRNALSLNASGGTFMYMAVAENPFGGSNVAPVNAR